MGYFVFKTLATALLIAGISEISKRFTFLASVLASLPLTTVLVFTWIYVEQKDLPKISVMSMEVFFLVIPSLVFFLILPLLFKAGLGFFSAILVDVCFTFAVYIFYIRLLKIILPNINL